MTLNRKTYLLAGGIAVVIVLVVAGMMLSRRSSAQAVMNDVWERLQGAHSLHAKAELLLHPALPQGARERPFTQATIRVEGDVQYAENGAPELTGKLYSEARGRGTIFFADGDVRLLHDAVAFRLENLPVLLNPSGSLIKRWTYVDVPALQASNTSDVLAAVREAAQQLRYEGKQDLDGDSAYYLTGSLTPEHEDKLISVLQQSTSGSRALHVVARLLGAADADSVKVWVDTGSHELRQLEVVFSRPLRDQKAPVATLRLSLRDYNKAVSIERPPREASVNPSVFARIFGTGDLKIEE